MPTSSSARRYAEAVFDIAQHDGTVDQWLAHLERTAALVADAGTVRRLEDPAVPVEDRARAMIAAVGPDVSPKLENLLRLLLRRRRLEMLPRLAREFRHLYNRRAGITEATAISAAPLTDVDVAALRHRLEQLAGGRVELTLMTDPSLIGGVQVRLGDRLIDGSVRGRLERLRSRLATGA
ncbi:MAG TPA: F0F1 ATP synthase subunit delta [Candidatus Caenarcaniphilales bacterium]|nr:F0F1 ATP synthase subunit delta [Candidatus Caenarcaniphilales bacterium]